MTADETEKLIASLKAKIDTTADPENRDALVSELEILGTQYARKTRQLDRLVRLSDATEAKLTETNSTLTDFSENLSRFVPKPVADDLIRNGGKSVAETERRDVTCLLYTSPSPRDS